MPSPRIRELDVLRGFAVCGITVVNAWQHAVRRYPGPRDSPVDWAVDTLLEGRFYPIFAFLFGIGCALFLRSARERTAWPRLALLRRLLVLGVIFGLPHWMVNPGEVLLPYAIFGVVVLLPFSLLPRAAALAGGAVIVLAALYQGDVWLPIPGLFLLGLALAGYGMPRWPLVPACLLGTAVTVPLTWATAVGAVPPPALPAPGVTAATGGALAYATGLVLLLRTPLGRPLAAVLEPLGRMALTNYLTSTAVILATLEVTGADPTRWSAVAVAVLTLAVQAAAGRWWLARHRYGPLEWLWRALTWGPDRVAGAGAAESEHARSPVSDPDRRGPGGEPGAGP